MVLLGSCYARLTARQCQSSPVQPSFARPRRLAFLNFAALLLPLRTAVYHAETAPSRASVLEWMCACPLAQPAPFSSCFNRLGDRLPASPSRGVLLCSLPPCSPCDCSSVHRLTASCTRLPRTRARGGIAGAPLGSHLSSGRNKGTPLRPLHLTAAPARRYDSNSPLLSCWSHGGAGFAGGRTTCDGLWRPSHRQSRRLPATTPASGLCLRETVSDGHATGIMGQPAR